MSIRDPGDPVTPAHRFELVYVSMHGRPSFAFPCDESGAVLLNDLSSAARSNYLLARALVGRDFQLPVVVAV